MGSDLALRCLFICYVKPNPLFQTLSTTAVIFFDLHKAPAQFCSLKGRHLPTFVRYHLEFYGIAFTWPFLDMPPFFCSGRMRSAGLDGRIYP
jgi:hypothetical protein